MGLLLQAGAGGYGSALVQAVLALLGVSILAWVILRWVSRRGWAKAGRIRVVDRLVLEPRRALYLVQVGDRVLLIGTGEGAAPTLLSEFEPDEVPAGPDRASGLGELLAKLGTSGEKDD